MFIGGLLLLATAGLGRLIARRKGLEFRHPDPDERDAIAHPLARIAVRRLPMHLVDADLGDGMEAIVAAHDYLSAGPLTYEPAPDPTDDTTGDDT